MYRDHLLALLSRYQQAYPDESACVERFIAFVSGYPNCFERSLSIGHVTGSAWLMNQAQTHVLLTLHKNLNKWLQLGGHADGNPHVLDVAIREAQEESGLSECAVLSENIFDIDIHAIPQHDEEAEHFHYDVRFAVHSTDSEEYQVSDESHDLAWVKIQDVQQLTQEESMLRMVRKWLGRFQTEEMP